MNVGGGLRYVTGPMGAGKSLYGVRAIVARIIAGDYAVTNIKLNEDYAERIGFHLAPVSKRNRRKIADKCRRFYVYETSLDEARRYRLPGKGESRALFVWDEAHNDLNNRTYRDRDQSLLEWATQLRKLGFEGVLLSQSHENTDAQLRRICNWLVRLQNQRESTRFLGVRVSPWPLFIAWWYMSNVPQGSKVTPMRTERYFLSWHRHLYDTLDLFHGVALLDDSLEAGVVELPAGGRDPGARLPPVRVGLDPGERTSGALSSVPASIVPSTVTTAADSRTANPPRLAAPETRDELYPRRVLPGS